MLVKYKQNCMIKTTQNFQLFDKKLGWNKLFILRLPSFSVPKITVVQHVQPS